MPDWIMHLLGMGGVGVSVYAGIRADLAAMKAQLENLTNTANHAHQRIDSLMMKGTEK